MSIVTAEIFIVVIVEVMRKFNEDDVIFFIRDVLINLLMFWIFLMISWKGRYFINKLIGKF